MSMYERLLSHVGHEVVVAYYGEMPEPANVAIECETCHEVIVDQDREVEEEKPDEQLAAYIAAYINEEIDRSRASPSVVMIGMEFVTTEMISSAVEAYEGGAR